MPQPLPALIVKRDGRMVAFDFGRIRAAIAPRGRRHRRLRRIGGGEAWTWIPS